MAIANYFAEVGVHADMAQLRKVDAYLAVIENKLKVFSSKANNLIKLQISGFTVDQTKLNVALGAALDVASSRLSFHISRFSIDQAHLNAAMINAVATATKAAEAATRLRPRVGPAQGIPQGEGGIRPRAAVAAGGVAGGLSRLYGPAIALGLGGYGLSELNKKNQQVVAAQLQSQAVVMQNGGSAEQGKDSFEWLRYQGNKIGFDYLKASPQYNNLLANMTGAGYSVRQGQDVFKSFAELSRTYKLDSVQQQRVFLALSQIAGKGQLQSQELKLQLGQALPGAESLFAQAYQNMLKASGKGKGDATGQEAIGALLQGMKKGQVSSDILNYVAPLVHQKAEDGGLAYAEQASAAQQERFKNAITDMARVASESGLEEGFARIFKTLAQGIEESTGLVKDLAGAFNTATQYWSYLALIPQDIQRMFAGKDSVVADWLWGKGEDGTKILANVLELRDLFKNIGELGKTAYEGWKMLFDLMKSINFDSAGVLVASLNEALKAILALKNGDAKATGELSQNAIKGIADSNPITGLPLKILDWAFPKDKDVPEDGSHSLRGILHNLGAGGWGSKDWFDTRPTLNEAGGILSQDQQNKKLTSEGANAILDPVAALDYNNKLNGKSIVWQFMEDRKAESALAPSSNLPDDSAGNPIGYGSYKPDWQQNLQLAPLSMPTVDAGASRDKDQAALSTTTSNNTTNNTFNLEVHFDATLGSALEPERAGQTFSEWFKNEIGTASLNYPNNQ